MNKYIGIAIDKEIKIWTEQNAPIGRELGYPECCIKAFCDLPPVLLQKMKPTKEDKVRFRAAHVNGKFSGFIPCIEHAKQIMTGQITLVSLIKNRSAQFPTFPNF